MRAFAISGLFFIVAQAPFVPALAEGLVPGVYNAKHDSGELVLKPAAKGKVKFRVFTQGGGGQTCEVTGMVPANAFETKVPVGDEDEERECTIRFKGIKKGYSVSVPEASNEACRGFCGARATFTKEFRNVDPACLRKGVRATRAKAGKAYQGKKFDEAAKLLSPLLDQCEEELPRLAEVDVRNTLADALLQGGDVPGCKRVLLPLREMVGITPAQIRVEYSAEPGVVDEWIRVTQATNALWGRCAPPTSDEGTR